MLKFITKHEYWGLVDEGIEDPLRKGVFPWHLKSVQDALAFSMILESDGLEVAEIGGGDSRILPALTARNTCFNIETFEGRDGGPAEEISFEKVTNIAATVGESHDIIADNSFDVVFSVSVVEHVPNPVLPAFIADCHRILKPGGSMVHLVDMYVSDERYDYNLARTHLYTAAFTPELFAPVGPLEIDADHLGFDNSYCTNPDNMMQVWNVVAPSLRETRETSQSVTLAWVGTANS